MMRRLISLVTLIALVLATAPLAAHDQFRIIGTIVTFKDYQLVVKTKAGETFTITLERSTLIQRDKKRVALTEPKVGRSVAVDVMADSLCDEDRFVTAVTLVPAIAPSRTQ